MKEFKEHPLEEFGYKKPPHWLWRFSKFTYSFVGKFTDSWLIFTGKLSLHRAWQAGYDHGTAHEWERAIVNMGEIEMQRKNVEKADKNIQQHHATLIGSPK